ncbi:hypothetical protein Cch02nite_35290 [Catellatospora chokoriensis]|uniref:Uncharacterized protein n=3 Tax=Catellatospora chokoriensis TaxID=310353 RepID=A0A8J3NRM5_9ACTN|nr:hypothetical protein Cch02nite_35290 [Catellatospora chokoriensis]
MSSITLCDMAHGYGAGSGDWPPSSRRDPRDRDTPGPRLPGDTGAGRHGSLRDSAHNSESPSRTGAAGGAGRRRAPEPPQNPDRFDGFAERKPPREHPGAVPGRPGGAAPGRSGGRAVPPQQPARGDGPGPAPGPRSPAGPQGYEPPRRGEPRIGEPPRRNVPGEPPGARNGALARPRGVEDPPPTMRRGFAPGAPPAAPPGAPPRRNVTEPRQRSAPPATPVSPGIAPDRPGMPPRTAPNPAMPVRVAPPPPTRPTIAPPPPPPLSPARRTGPRPAVAGEPVVAAGWQRLAANQNMSSRWKKALSVLGVLAVLTVCGVGSFLMVLDEKQGTGAQANSSPPPTATAVDITSREVDPKPLTANEVFPGKQIVIDPAKPTEVYAVIKPQVLTDCRAAASGELSKLITDLGCSQVVRGTMRSPNGAYLVTGGIVNLDTVANAEKAYEAIKPIVDNGKGRFLGYAPDRQANKSITKPLALASTHAGWNIRGHYLVYCVIARSDGEEIPIGDPFAKQILFDVIEFYLRGKVLEDRASDPIAPTGDPAPSAS